ncbi:MAG: ABC transporter permease [Opitutales bacterium]
METTIIESRKGLLPSFRFKELYNYRDLLVFLVLRDIRARYAQSLLGVGWAVIQPVFQMVVFTIILGRLAGVPSDGAPYAIFSFVALVPWTFFANSLTGSSNSLVANAGMLSKVYFPRLVIPLSAMLAKLVDFLIAFAVLGVLLVYYGQAPSWDIVYLPWLILVLVLCSTGVGFWLTALSIQYRDVQYAMGFGVQLAMYGSPVVFSASLVPEEWQSVFALNPMVGVIEGFRSIFLQTIDFPFSWVAMGTCISSLIFVSGWIFFVSRERIFADVA